MPVIMMKMMLDSWKPWNKFILTFLINKMWMAMPILRYLVKVRFK